LIHIFTKAQASVIDIRHERVFGEASLREVQVDVTLETSGFDHIQEIKTALENEGYKPRFL